MKKKIVFREQLSATIKEQYDAFILAQTAKGISAATIKSYHSHLKGISKHLDVEMPFEELTKKHIEQMVVSMRAADLAHNSVATYLRAMNTFLRWCHREGWDDVSIPNLKEKDTVKETYTDEELIRLLRKPKRDCGFCEYRNWVIVNYLLNSGCRASTLRNIQNKDVDLGGRRIIYRHTKSGKIQVNPLCSQMASILSDYMDARGGEPDAPLFCNQYGEMLTENALRLAIAHYNKSRGVTKTSLHLFRHTFARKYLVDCGGNAFTLQRLLGHSTLSMSKRYCNIYDADIARNYDAFSPLAQMTQTKEKLRRR